MHNSFSTMALTSLLLLHLLLLSSLHVLTTVARATPEADSLADEANSISPKAYLVHYWNEQITNNLPKPPILFTKASPLTAVSATIFAELVAKGAISDHLLSFCEEAQLLCFMNSSSYGVAKTIDAQLYKVYPRGPPPDTIVATDDKKVNGGMEQGLFFRESMLKSGNVMPMPDLRDNFPKTSFLPRRISSKLPFSTSKLAELKQIFHAIENSTMEKIMAQTLGLCEGAALQDETKRCVASIEDMIDFATSVLGHDVMVRSTESARGSKQEVLIGVVKRIEGSEGSKPVACHQSLFPYIVYYCHAFPNVRVYEADILDPKSKAMINHGVAICHMDTSTWSPAHGSFLLLGSGPGQIEVCHWINENNMMWTIAK
ncbi:polygalacturonase non-catalytic subunit AroGP2-like isoform X2 [Eucalyptus grandis]|uniref:polygalacturonase non-catalytic subunit AroGP2-like isoform X2 n=1 Tax=Eucalyptus grandis TaxID=71139 RepID=UPI00192EEF8A|nr:polygalacturonase non-catalytic subunit AroGP2-like isoform X2 [Eucalyptus grandis]